MKDITRDCVEAAAAFICLDVEKPCRIFKPVRDKTLILIGLGPLRPSNGMFRGRNLAAGASTVVSGDGLQGFDGGCRGGGFGVVLRVKFEMSSG